MPRNSPVYARELFAILTPSLPRNPGEVIEHQCSWLTNRASEGPHYKDATFLCVHSERVTVSMAREFELGKLTSLYLRATPHLPALSGPLQQAAWQARFRSFFSSVFNSQYWPFYIVLNY